MILGFLKTKTHDDGSTELTEQAVSASNPAPVANYIAGAAVSSSNPIPTTPAGNVASAATDSGNPIKVGGVYRAALPTLTDGQRGDLQLANDGSPRVRLTGVVGVPANGASNAAAYLLGGDHTTPRSLSVFPSRFNGTTWDPDTKPNAVSRLLSSAATTNATSVKGSAGNLSKITGNNTVASKRYLKFYNKATAPTVGTDTPVMTFVLLASAAFTIDLPSHFFSTGIAYAITGAAADADTTAIAVGDIECLNIAYA